MFEKIRLKTNDSDFFKNILVLITGTGVAQLIPVLLQFILRRLYSPEEFAVYAIYISIAGTLAIFATMRFELAVLLPEKKNDAKNIVYLTWIINLLFNIFLFLVLLVFKNFFSSLIGIPEKYTNYILLIPVSILFLCFYQSINYWLIREKAFKANSFNKITRRVSEGTVQIGFGFLKSSSGLFLGDIIGNIFNNISGYFQLKKNKFHFGKLNISDIKQMFKRYSDFPKYNMFPSFLDSFTLTIPLLFINKVYSSVNASYFDLTRQAVLVPLVLISSSVSQVLIQRISERKASSLSIKKNITDVFYSLLIIGLISVVVILLFGTELFGIAFGQRWAVSGDYSKILIFCYVIRFVVSPLSVVFIALEKIKVSGIWQLFYFLLIISLFLFRKFTFINFLKIYVGFEIFAYAVYFIIIYFIIKNYESRIIEK